MSIQIISKLKKHFTCKCLGHEQQPLDYICVQQACNQQHLVCFLCSIDKHHKHDKILLKVFLNQLLSVQTNSQNLVMLTASFDKKLIAIKSKIYLEKQKFNNFQNILRTFKDYGNYLKLEANKYESIAHQLKILFEGQNQLVTQRLNNFVRQTYFKYFADVQPEQWVHFNICQHILKLKNDNLQQIIGSIQKLEQSHKLNDSSILSLFPTFEEVQRKIKVIFSQQMKGQCMAIIDSTNAKMDKSGSQRLLVLQPCLTKTNSVKKWSVKIEKLASWIGVGVCHINQIKKANYMFNYSTTGHGSYLISSNGYSWSSFKPQFNSKFEPFSYTTNDLIHIQLDPKQKVIRFSKQGTDQKYTLDYDANDDPIHPLINLTGIGDEVRIVQ